MYHKSRNSQQGTFESLAQYSEEFQETSQTYKNTSKDKIETKEEVLAMVGLDKGRFGTFKADMLTSWAAWAFESPMTVNQIYCTAGSWVKQAPKIVGRAASMYVTM
jgi:hypothetical protein